uniref:Uncharacterized protein n=1 Tax=viral metagenome TaxID=1070528 RepID=A0A6C0BPM6_9ZZZZ
MKRDWSQTVAGEIVTGGDITQLLQNHPFGQDDIPIEILDQVVYTANIFIRRAKRNHLSDIITLEERLNEGIIPVAQWLNETRDLSPEEIKEFALGQSLYKLAQAFGATDQDVQHARTANAAQLFLSKKLEYDPTDEIVDDVMTYIRRLHKKGYDFRLLDTYTNVLELFTDHQSGPIAEKRWRGWRPVFDFLIKVVGLDPREGTDKGRDTALSLARDPELRKYLMDVLIEHQGNHVRGEMDGRTDLLRRGEMSPGRSMREVPRDLIKRITFQAAGKEVCDDIQDGQIPPLQLVGLAKVMGVTFDQDTPWRELCAKVQDQIQRMLL